jgi:valyl-tRNA synthetase
MSMRPQAHDIIRTWAFYTVLKSWIHHRALPWPDAVISGHVQAQGGVKISKSKGNAPIDPVEVVTKHGADAVRFWALSAKLGTDYVFSEDDVSAGRKLCMKLWNASRLVLGHLQGYDPAGPRAPERAVDRGIRLRFAQTAAEATELLDAYEFGLAKKRVEEFFFGDLCDQWLEMAKDRLYDTSPESAAVRRSTQACAFDVLYGTLRLLSPFIPHVAEVVHQAYFRGATGQAVLSRAPWPGESRPAGEEPALSAYALATQVLGGVRRWRSENKVSPGKTLGRARVLLPAATNGAWPSVEADVRAAGRVTTFETAPGPAGATEAAVEVLEGPVS